MSLTQSALGSERAFDLAVALVELEGPERYYVLKTEQMRELSVDVS